MLSPSNATPKGFVPTPTVTSAVPSLARNLVTVLSLKFVTQTLSASKATPTGAAPTPKVVVRFASYQCRMAIWSGFRVDITTPPPMTLGATCTSFDANNKDTLKTVITVRRGISEQRTSYANRIGIFRMEPLASPRWGLISHPLLGL